MSLTMQVGASARDLEDFAPVVGWAYGDSLERATQWLQGTGLQNIRVARAAGKVVAGLVEVPMGQWFGERSVSTLGVAGVAVAAEARGLGHAQTVVRQALRDARASGVALSTLYPSTPSLYRKLGYEYAGTYCRSVLSTAAAVRAKGALPIVDLGPEHTDAVAALYRASARHRPGYLERGPLISSYIKGTPDKLSRALGVLGSGGLEGYAYIAQRETTETHHDLILRDFVAATPAALHTMLNFFARHSTTADNVIWTGTAVDARLLAIADRTPKVEVRKYWMLRLVHVEAALRARGYAPVTAALDIEVDDPVLPENSGCYAVRLAAGRIELERSRRAASVVIASGALAALYSGFVSAEDLVAAGLLVASADAAHTLSHMFQGPAPSCPDYF